ncbi:hypothetical protein Hanom_Chr02g00107691 [Helianthus anomalus]
MSSFWDGNYIFGQYSSDNWGHESVPSGVPDSNEQEEVVSSIQGKQNNPFQPAATAVSGVPPQIFFSFIVCCIGGRAR